MKHMNALYVLLVVVVGLLGCCAAQNCTVSIQHCTSCSPQYPSVCAQCDPGYYLNQYGYDMKGCLAVCPNGTYANSATMTCDVCTGGLSTCWVGRDDYSISSYSCYNATTTTCCGAFAGGVQGQVCPGTASEYSCCPGYKANSCKKNGEQYCCGSAPYTVPCMMNQGCCGGWPTCYTINVTFCCPNQPSVKCQVGQICLDSSGPCADCPAGTYGPQGASSLTGCLNCSANCGACTSANACTQCATGFSLVNGLCASSTTPAPPRPPTQSPTSPSTPTTSPTGSTSDAYCTGVSTLFVFILGALFLF